VNDNEADGWQQGGSKAVRQVDDVVVGRFREGEPYWGSRVIASRETSHRSTEPKTE
jgi:hypothetical protein